jgi:hypothetical protein
MTVKFLQDYYPFLKGDKVGTSIFLGRHRIDWIDENNYHQEYYVDLLRGKRIIEIISDVDISNLKVGDKVIVETLLEVGYIDEDSQDFNVYDENGDCYPYKLSDIKRIIPN